MGNFPKIQDIKRQIDISSYAINGLEDEVRVDQQCSALLKTFHQDLVRVQQRDPLEAGSQAAGADYFLRDFVIGHQRRNIFEVTAPAVRIFAGHWYIVNNLEPNLAELTAMLQGADSFYQYCADAGLIEDVVAAEISLICKDFSYYQQRIDTFLDLSGDGFSAWGKECPLT